MNKATLHKDGSVTVIGYGKAGTWKRVLNGRTDRGVKQGDWVGRDGAGVTSPQFQRKCDLASWFTRRVKEQRT